MEYGQGPWAYGFLELKDPPMFGVDGDRLALAILAIKREFNYNGYPADDTAIYDEAFVSDVVKPFQKANGLEESGVIDPATAGRLWHKRTQEVEFKYGIPDQWLGKLRSLKSANDPAAVGWVGSHERGLLQINAYYHPEVTDAQAFDPAFALDYGGKALYSAHSRFSDWEVALAAQDVGLFGAQMWQESDKQQFSGMDRYPSLYSRAYNYVNMVRDQGV